MDATTFSSLLRQRLATSGELTFRAGGLSMLPAIPPGARLRVVRLQAADPLPGAIYLFDSPRGPRAHRFVGAGEGGLRFRGDNAPRTYVVTVGALIGRVDALVVLGRPVVLTSPAVKAFGVFGGLALRVLRRVTSDRARNRLGGALRRWIEARDQNSHTTSTTG